MHLLIVEDEPIAAGELANDFNVYGHSSVVARDGRDALFIAEAERFDAIVLDLMLPLIDGIEFVRRLRNRNDQTPILMLTALGDLAHRVEGLETGADDYLVKPAAPSELNARLGAIVRRSAAYSGTEKLRVDNIELDVIRQSVRSDNRSVQLQPIEFRILRELMLHSGKVVTRSMLLEKVWGYHFEPGSNIVDLHIHKLRAHLRESGIVDPITTVRGAGYRVG